MKPICNLTIIGAGTAGLGAAIRAVTEDIDVTILDKEINGYGGQMGHTSRIHNYPGFPGGITGSDFIAKLVVQAEELGTKLRAPFDARKIERKDDLWIITEESGEELTSGMVLLASGAMYRRLNATNIARFLGRGINYSPPPHIENFSGKKVCIIGGGNSAAQAALDLAACTDCKVTMIVRAENFTTTMSGMYIHRIEKCENIEVLYKTEVVEVEGSVDNGLQKVHLKSVDGGVSVHEMDRMFILIGSEPKTAWLNDIGLSKDERGFIKAGSAIPETEWAKWKLERSPFSHEAAPGFFVAGDIHSGNPQSIVTAVADATIAVSDMHKYIFNVWEQNHK